jgi:hypothetical protein
VAVVVREVLGPEPEPPAPPVTWVVMVRGPEGVVVEPGGKVVVASPEVETVVVRVAVPLPVVTVVVALEPPFAAVIWKGIENWKMVLSDSRVTTRP